MHSVRANALAPILYLPHGGGPLPLLGDRDHLEMIDFLHEVTPTLGTPSAIVVISAHWEEQIPTITSGAKPPLIYDFVGFPEEAYRITYPAPGAPALANRLYQLLQENGVYARMDDRRGFDHGLYVPLKLMYPEAEIPCVQLSLVRDLDALTHLEIGSALAPLREENILIIGSGFSFHNLGAFFSHPSGVVDSGNIAFDEWLYETCCSTAISNDERLQRLADWEQAPSARRCHPRQEHLLPLHVCAGLADAPAQRVFNGTILGKRASAFLW